MRRRAADVRQFPHGLSEGEGRAPQAKPQAFDLPHTPSDRAWELRRRSVYLNMRQAAEFAGYDKPDSLYKQLRRDLVPLFRPTARRCLVSVGDLETWIRKNSSIGVDAVVEALRQR